MSCNIAHAYSKFVHTSPEKQARKLQATLVRNYDRLTYSLTGVKCRAISVAKNIDVLI